jgi:hypothetical protein
LITGSNPEVEMDRATLIGAVLLAALLGLLVGWYGGGHGGGQTGVAYASVDVTCGDKTYSVSTGNNKGECKSNGNGNSAVCDDGKGNSSEVFCSTGCGSAKGSGSCSVKTAK